MKVSRAWMLIPLVALAACPPTRLVLHEDEVSGRDTTRTPRGTVNVIVNCTSPISATVNPYRLRLGEHDSVVTWRFAGADSFRIAPQPPPPWPFEIAAPAGTDSARSGPITSPPAPGDTLFRYTITTRCGRTEVEIDPEVIIPD